MKKVFLVLSLFPVCVFAENELRSKAMAEISHQGPKIAKASATEVQVIEKADNESVLRLEDADFKNIKRNYEWLFGLKVQSFQPSGKMVSEEKAGVNLSGINSFYLPSLEGGFRRLGGETPATKWHWGMAGYPGYGSQSSNVVFDKDTNESDARLTTMLTSLGLNFDYELSSAWGLDAGLGYGVLTYSHSGSSSYSNFSEQAAYRQASAGAHLNVQGDWQVFVNYSNKNLVDETVTIALPTDSFELGTRLVW